MLDEKTTWQECFDAGMTAKQASEARGTCLSAAHGWSKRQGLKWPRPDNRAILSAKAKLRYATDPARRRQNAEHLASMKEKRAAAMRKAMSPGIACIIRNDITPTTKATPAACNRRKARVRSAKVTARSPPISARRSVHRGRSRSP